MDKIDEKLTSAIIDLKLDPSIRIALTLGKKTLEQYYSKTDDTEAYRICMSTSMPSVCFMLFIHICSSASPSV